MGNDEVSGAMPPHEFQQMVCGSVCALTPQSHLREERGRQLELQALLLPQVALQLVAQLERRQVLPRRQRRVVQLRQARLCNAGGGSGMASTIIIPPTWEVSVVLGCCHGSDCATLNRDKMRACAAFCDAQGQRGRRSMRALRCTAGVTSTDNLRHHARVGRQSNPTRLASGSAKMRHSRSPPAASGRSIDSPNESVSVHHLHVRASCCALAQFGPAASG